MFIKCIHFTLNFFSDSSNKMTKIDFRKLTQNLRGEVLIMHLTNKLQNTSNVQKIWETIPRKLKIYLKTIIVTGKLYYFTLLLLLQVNFIILL